MNLDMKRIIALVVALSMPLLMSAQAKIITKKMKIGDFPTKTTKVVMTGNPFYDGSLQEEMNSRWRISPYEFCSLEEYDRLKTDPSYYFLLTVAGQFKSENAPGVKMLTLVKGGLGSDKGLDGMFEVITVPLCPAEDPSGREIVMLPALLDIVQNYVTDAMETDLEGYSGLTNYSLNLKKARRFKIAFAEEDLAAEVDAAVRAAYIDANMEVAEADYVDEYMDSHAPKTLVSYVVAPSGNGEGSYCYKMLIDAGTHQLYYFRKHKITKKYGVGFLTEDLKKIAASR